MCPLFRGKINIIALLEPYYRSIGKRLVKSPKLYFLDTGLAAHLMGLSSWQEIEKSHLAGAIWETYAFNQIYRAFLEQGITNPPLYYWRTKDGQGVDFLIDKGGRFIAIETKLTGAPGPDALKGLHALRGYYGDNAFIKGMVICRVKEEFALGKQARAINGIKTDFAL